MRPGDGAGLYGQLPVVGGSLSNVVCTECPWRLRHEYPQPMGLICRTHIERYDGAPAPELLTLWLKRHGFREDCLDWFPSRRALAVLQAIRAKMS